MTVVKLLIFTVKDVAVDGKVNAVTAGAVVVDGLLVLCPVKVPLIVAELFDHDPLQLPVLSMDPEKVAPEVEEPAAIFVDPAPETFPVALSLP